jgi:hypothetical protein
LGSLQVGKAWRCEVDVLPRLVDKCSLQIHDDFSNRPSLSPEIEPKVCGYLVIPRSASAELPTDRAQSLDQDSLNASVDVLVLKIWAEKSRGQFGTELVYPRLDSGELLVGQQFSTPQNTGVCPRLQQVVRR